MNQVSQYHGYNRTARGNWFRAVLDTAGNIIYSGDSGVTETAHTLICDSDPAVFAAEVPAPTWQPGMAVAEGDMLTYNGTVYRVRQAHTTQADWLPDQVLALYQVVAVPNPSGGTPAWQAGVAYAVGDLVTYGGSTYKCLQAHTSQSTWTPPATPALWQLQ